MAFTLRRHLFYQMSEWDGNPCYCGLYSVTSQAFSKKLFINRNPIRQLLRENLVSYQIIPFYGCMKNRVNGNNVGKKTCC